MAERANVYRWSGTSWTPIGTLPEGIGYHPFGPGAVTDGGALWFAASVQPEGTGGFTDWYLERAVPGSGRVQSWRIHGEFLAVGPGYAVFAPASYPTNVAVYFPLRRRTLHFGSYLSVNDRQPQVGLYFDPAMDLVPLPAHNRALEVEAP